MQKAILERFIRVYKVELAKKHVWRYRHRIADDGREGRSSGL